MFLVEQSGMTVQQAVDGKTVTDGTMHKYKNTDMMEQRLAQNNDKNKTQALPLSCCPVPGTAGFVLTGGNRPPTLSYANQD